MNLFSIKLLFSKVLFWGCKDKACRAKYKIKLALIFVSSTSKSHVTCDGESLQFRHSSVTAGFHNGEEAKVERRRSEGRTAI